ncbi:hypothetical protein TNCT_102531 [Trichonephila clavata]|uniref:Uncharacterized protein n=1 Tax=Trichonephila clavata TaxID=2740835 RepID=A0A8X6GAA3_TRICU|nr:hypothetical protein TNCT_102531 [Trichonephila clavata]
MNLRKASKNCSVLIEGRSSRCKARVVAHVNKSRECFLSLSFMKKGPAKSNPEIENGGDSKTRSGGKGAISWLPGRTVYFLHKKHLLKIDLTHWRPFKIQNFSLTWAKVASTSA